MFTAYMSFVIPTAFGLIGKAVRVFVGETDPLPQMEGVCRRSDFLQFGRQCVEEAPCVDCQYFPIYPIATVPPRTACIMAYTDDFLFETAAPMANAMASEGHSATLLQFPDIGRGHSNALMHWDWLVGCMGVVGRGAACSEAVVDCVEDGAGNSAQIRQGHYNDCLGAGLADCSASCAPTMAMLRTVERPCLVDGVCDGADPARMPMIAVEISVAVAGEARLPSCVVDSRQYVLW